MPRYNNEFHRLSPIMEGRSRRSKRGQAGIVLAFLLSTAASCFALWVVIHLVLSFL